MPRRYIYYMKRTLTPLSDCGQTAREIARIVNRYYKDLDLILYLRPGGRQSQPIGKMTLQEFFNFIKNIPFKVDEKPIEYVARPYYIMKERGIDCKKKTIMVASFLKLHDIPFRLIGSSIRPDGKIHHIFPRAFINRQWRTIDATYPENQIFRGRHNTTEVIFYDSKQQG